MYISIPYIKKGYMVKINLLIKTNI